MSNASRRKIVLCLLLATTLAVPGASAAGRASAGPPDLLNRIWSFFTSLWGETGCDVDPFGRCAQGLAAPPPAQADTGCDVDPNGRCRNL